MGKSAAKSSALRRAIASTRARSCGHAVAFEGQADRAAVVVGEIGAQVLGLVDRDALARERVPQRAEVERLAVHQHAVEIEEHRPHVR